MTAEQIVRDQLERATENVPGGPDLERAVRSGRRRRGLHRGGLAVAAVAVLGLGTAGVHTVATGGPTTVHDRQHSPQHGVPVADPASGPTDYVPGTDIDTKLAAVVAAHLPQLPAPDDVYPSDGDTAGPLADADWSSAEDWQATYTEAGNQVLVMTGLASEGDNSCKSCPSHQVAGGTVHRQDYSSVGDDGQTRWYFGTFFTRDDGSFANAWEVVAVDGEPAARGQRQVADGDLAALVQDPGLTFAALGAPTP
jgi:hypothetical protein